MTFLNSGLRSFATGGSTILSDDQIERAVERKMNRLDAKLLNGTLTQTEYDLAVAHLDGWAQLQGLR